jgi:hypothetical protein
MGLRERVEAGANAAPVMAMSGPPEPTSLDIEAARRNGFVDVGDSGIPAELDVPVHIAWSRVMGDVQWIGKNSRADKYMFRGIDAVRNAVGPALRKHGVLVLPVSTKAEYSTVSRSGGGLMTYCRCTVNFAVFGPQGDRLGGPDFTIETMGEAFDTGDKSSMKAQSVAERTLYVAGLTIATDQPTADPEAGPQYELAAPARPTAAEYAAEIMDERTSIRRLQQIKAELDADPRTAHTEIEQLDGTQIELGRLVRRVGAARQAAEKGE